MGIRVLSLFDGMSCGQIALDRIGIEVDDYYASEIDKYAMAVTKSNFPDTIHVGDITKLDHKDFTDIDLLFGGSPCQSFSNVGDGTGFDGKSGLFYDFVRLLKEVKPKYFLLENVRMKQEWEDVITKELGVKPIKINSKLVSAQNRPRLYWTNIPGVEQPDDKGIVIEDVITPTFNGTHPGYLDKYFGSKQKIDLVKKYDSKASCLTATMYKGQVSSFCKNDSNDTYRYSPEDCEILQTVPVGYTNAELNGKAISKTQRYRMLGNGWTVDVIAHIFENLKGLI